MSFKPEVSTDSSGKFYGNALAFATEVEALRSAADLAARWVLVRDFRAVASNETVNFAYVDGELKAVEVARPTPAERQDKWDRLGGLHMP